jgi:DNA-directed RNA polymerase I, II, and III subunit RPABC3
VHSHVFVSFGGLLLYIDGPYQQLNALKIDHVYLLVKR